MVSADGPRKFLKIYSSRLAKTSLFRQGLNKIYQEKLSHFLENNSLFIKPDDQFELNDQK